MKIIMKKITLYGLFALLILGFATVPSSTKADFFDDFVDFLDPTQHIGNILEGRPQDNLPPLPGLPIDLDLSTTVVKNYYTPSYNPPHQPSPAPRAVCQDINAINYYGTLPCRYYHQTTPVAYYKPYSNYYYDYRPFIGNLSVSLRADDSNIDFEDNTTLRWSSSNADTCRASNGDNGWSGSIDTSGSFNTRSLTDTTTYRITCYNNNDSASDSVTVYVDDDEDESNEPDVTTRSATNVGAGSATLNGRVDGNGSSVRAWFEYGTNTNFGYLTSKSSYGSRSTDYNKNISGLTPNTTYYFRAVAENSRDTVYGNIFYFNTGGSPVNNIVNIQPTVTISADSTNIAYNSATNIRWFTTNASSCFASGGSASWAGVKNIGPGSFYTGLLTSSKTYIIICSNNAGSFTDSVTVTVRGQVTAIPASNSKPTPTSLVLINSSVDRNQPITPTLDNTRPRPGDEINYTVSYQNIGNASITGLILRIDLPYQVDYIFSNPNNPIRSGNTLVFNLGTLKANGQDTVTVRLRVQNNVPAGINLSFPATLSYIDPSNFPQSVVANVSAQVWSEPAPALAPSSIDENENVSLGANAFGAGFLPTNLLGWSLLLVLILLLILIAKHLFGSNQPFAFHKQIIPVSSHPLDLDKETTATIKTQEGGINNKENGNFSDADK